MIIDVSIENREHLPEVLAAAGVDGVILPGDRLAPEEWGPVCRQVQDAGKKACFAFPYVMRTPVSDYYKKHIVRLREAGFDGWLVRSLDEAGFLAEQELPGLRIFDQGMYTWNRRAVAVMKELGADITTLSYENRLQEMNDRGFEDSELVIYGRLPVMISAQCTRMTRGCCRVRQGMKREEAAKVTEFLPLADRRKAEFLEDSHCRFCGSVIYNSVPLWLADKVPAACERVRFSFTAEAVGEPGRILARCIRTGEETCVLPVEPVGSFTRGHLKRGVE